MPTVRLLASGMSAATNLAPALLQLEQEGRVAAQPVQLGYHESGTSDLGMMERSGQFGTAVPLSGLHLGELREHICFPRLAEPLHGAALGVEPETAPALGSG